MAIYNRSKNGTLDTNGLMQQQQMEAQMNFTVVFIVCWSLDLCCCICVVEEFVIILHHVVLFGSTENDRTTTTETMGGT